MTSPEVQNRIQQFQRHGFSYVELTRDNNSGFYPDHEAGPADIAQNIMVSALNRPGLVQRVKYGKVLDTLDDDPSTCFELKHWNVKSIVKSMAVSAIEEFGLSYFGYIDINEAVKTSGRAQNTAVKVDSLARSATSRIGTITLIAVEAGENLQGFELESARNIYRSLSELPPETYRVAVLSRSDIFNQVAEV